jgi:hypothetical protein
VHFRLNFLHFIFAFFFQGTIGTRSKNRGIFQLDISDYFGDIMFTSIPYYSQQFFEKRYQMYQQFIEEEKKLKKQLAEKLSTTQAKISNDQMNATCLFFFSNRPV